MSKVMTPDQLVAQLKKWKVPFDGYDGWRTRGRPESLGWGNMHGIANHHTATRATDGSGNDATAATNRLLVVGRSDLPGPLAQFGTQRNGVVKIIAAGRANHAGAVRTEVLNDFLADRHVTRPTTTAGEDEDANAWLYGNEVHNNGTGEKYPDAQLESIVLLNAAICDFHGWSHFAASQHKNITARKIDMADIRGEDSDDWVLREVKVALAGGPGTYALPWNRNVAPDPQEDDMAYSEAQMVNFARVAVQAELGDENTGAFSDRVADKAAAKVIAYIQANPAPAPSAPTTVTVDLEALASAVADKLATRLAQ